MLTFFKVISAKKKGKWKALYFFSPYSSGIVNSLQLNNKSKWFLRKIAQATQLKNDNQQLDDFDCRLSDANVAEVIKKVI